ncbi:hypothetical protein TASCI_10128 [Tenacibaculum ascidiaceicola]
MFLILIFFSFIVTAIHQIHIRKRKCIIKRALSNKGKLKSKFKKKEIKDINPSNIPTKKGMKNKRSPIWIELNLNISLIIFLSL